MLIRHLKLYNLLFQLVRKKISAKRFNSTRPFLAAALLVSVFLLNSCSELVRDDRISEGIIEFKVTYPKLKNSSVLKDFLPNKMTMKFRDNKFHSELSAAFGLFKTNIIAISDEEYAQTVKLIDKKYAVRYNRKTSEESNARLPAVSIRHTGNTKKLAGYTCKEAIIEVDKPEKEIYKIYYTDEINIEDPNWFTQFADIDGVLMEYQVERYNLCTRFQATSVEATKIEKDIFEVTDEYELISEERLNMEMMDIFEEFSDE